MIISPNMVRLVLITVFVVGASTFTVSESKDKLRHLGIAFAVTILMVIFGADFLAQLLNMVNP